MPKHQIKLKAQILIPATVEFIAEFDTDDGTAEVVGRGIVVEHAEYVTRRSVQEKFTRPQIDNLAFAALLQSKQLPVPCKGDEFHLSNQLYRASESTAARVNVLCETDHEREKRIVKPMPDAPSIGSVSAIDAFVTHILHTPTNKRGDLCLTDPGLAESDHPTILGDDENPF